MHAYQLMEHGKPGRFEYREVPDPIPGADEVVVRVRACGLNHLDLWTEKGELPTPIKLPRTQGGEVSGEIVELGVDVDQWQVGDRVAIQSNLFCGVCEFCQRGDESICLKSELLGVQRDGGFADMVLVPARALVRLPNAVDFTTGAALTLAASTAMHMLTDRTEVKPGDWVLVMAGASGVGSAAVQIAKQLGGQVIATGSTAEKREFAQALGADYVVDTSSPDWAVEVRKITGKRGVDVVVEHIGGPVLEQIFHCLARGGTIVTCGATAGREITLNLWPLFVKQQRLIGSYGRNRADLQATLEWAAEGKIKATIDAVYPLTEAGKAYERLHARQVLGKVLVEPGMTKADKWSKRGSGPSF
jgi:2-desacetyl-2-hydroxyethyl bacteriochlorophyllide A dehydrogenase